MIIHRFLEVTGGFEPPLKVLQTYALPLGYTPVNNTNGTDGCRTHYLRFMRSLHLPLCYSPNKINIMYDPYGTRTHVSGMKTQRLNHLTKRPTNTPRTIWKILGVFWSYIMAIINSNHRHEVKLDW